MRGSLHVDGQSIMDVDQVQSRDGSWFNFTQFQAIEGVGWLNVDLVWSDNTVIARAKLADMDEVSIFDSDFFARREPQELVDKSEL